MKCVFVTNVDVNPATMTAAHKRLVKWRINLVKGKRTSIPYFPAGTEYEHPNAAFFCQAGSAAPLDDECREATGLTEEQLEALQRQYKLTAAGILEADVELWDAGVITGYEENGDYIHGPNWDEWMKAHEAEKAKAKESDI